VVQALQRQFEATGKLSEYVFCNLMGQPLDNKNFSDRIWYPLLRHLGLNKRRPYQMRHTAATLWLASGEAPEWIARQLGHTSTEMLFRVYSRYVPNLTRQDGSAMERLLASQLATGALVRLHDATGTRGPSGEHPGARRDSVLDAPGSDVYVPIGDVPAQPRPKPRGIHAVQRQAPVVAMPIVIPEMSSGNEPQPPPVWFGHANQPPVRWLS
jgi:integrase